MTWFDLVNIVDFFKQWGQLMMISFLAATAQMYISGKKYTFFHHFMSVLIAIFAAYLASAFCDWQQFDDDLTTGVIGVTAYAAPHLLEALNKLIQYIAHNPKDILSSFLKGK